MPRTEFAAGGGVDAGATRPAWLDRTGVASGILTWTWAVIVLAVLLLIRWVGDRWWGVTVLLFLPRWLFLAPWPVLALASKIGGRPRQWVVQGVVALVIAGPLMWLSLPVHQLWAPRLEGTRVRIMTFNRGVAPPDERGLIGVIERERIDVICFQEGFPGQGGPLEDYFASRGWSRDRNGRYLASRFPIVEEMGPPVESGREEPGQSVILLRARVRAAPGMEFGLASVHMPTLRFGLYRFLDRDVDGLKQHVAWWDREMSRLMGALSEMGDVPILVGGDFNVPSDHASMAALRRSYRFAFEDSGWGYGYTRPSRYPWFRIDHVLASPEWTFARCRVGPDLGSDHLPLIAEAVLTRVEPASGGQTRGHGPTGMAIAAWHRER